MNDKPKSINQKKIPNPLLISLLFSIEKNLEIFLKIIETITNGDNTENIVAVNFTEFL